MPGREGANDHEEPKEKQEASALVDAAINAMRRIMAGLRPRVLDDLGLWAAREWMAGDFQARTGIRCALAIDPREPDLSPEASTAIFCIMQEALDNVDRHAQATEVQIIVREADGRLYVSVLDDGRGFAPAAAGHPGTFGLQAMTERAQALNGSLRIESNSGSGTVIRFELPLDSHMRVDVQ